ncbi:hypothetical protein HHA01_06140 [Halomonas halmophila]|uniref:Uncharacterized protein n=1 Tax=Halomonas halmophila TaxID=252 RepID=A0A4Y4EWR2_9GAMM|nr:hypothetical protein HHA01_06140 [Halomonas halmophila]
MHAPKRSPARVADILKQVLHDRRGECFGLSHGELPAATTRCDIAEREEGAVRHSF